MSMMKKSVGQRKEWTLKEEEILEWMVRNEEKDSEIAIALDRTLGSIRAKRMELGIRRFKRLTEEVKEKILNCNDNVAIADEMQVSEDWVRLTRNRIRVERGLTKPRKLISQSDRWKMIALREAGMKYAEIGRMFGCSETTAWEHVNLRGDE